MATAFEAAAALSLLSVHPSSSSSSSSSSKYLSFSSKQPPLSIKTNSFISTPLVSTTCPPFSESRKLCFEQLCSTAQEVAAETTTEQTHEGNLKRKLFVLNLPWSFSVADIKNLFGQCGTVSNVEIVKQKDGKNRGYAFVTMASGEEAQAVVDKFDSQEVSGRIIKVEFAKRFRKPSPPPPPGMPIGETRHKLYVSNLAWKVRAGNLREFFSADFKPVSSKVIFDGSTGKSAGYGFVSFSTREEAEAAISALDGKELMGRPLRLKFVEQKADEPGSTNQDQENSADQPGE